MNFAAPLDRLLLLSACMVQHKYSRRNLTKDLLEQLVLKLFSTIKSVVSGLFLQENSLHEIILEIYSTSTNFS